MGRLKFFRWAIPVVFDMITISRKRSQTQPVYILFIARYSLKLTTFVGLSSFRPSSGHSPLSRRPYNICYNI